VTSHSPDLLDDKSISDENILAVSNRNGETIIGPVDTAGRTSIRDNLFTAGELLRLSQLSPDLELVAKTRKASWNCSASATVDMVRLAAIVEGQGECEAVPILVRRIAQTLDVALAVSVHPVLRVPGSRLAKQGEIERTVELAARKNAGQGAILVLLDCDDGCPATTASRAA